MIKVDKKSYFIFLIGVILSFTVFLNMREASFLAWEVQFNQKISENMLILKGKLETNRRVLESISLYFGTTEDISREKFKKIVTPILRDHNFIQSLEWIPLVKRYERSEYEMMAKIDGLDDFNIKEINDNGKLVKSNERSEYFPVYFVEPYVGNENALGLDLSSETKRRKALNYARYTGEITATEKIILVQEKKKSAGLLMFSPVFNDNDSEKQHRSLRLTGFALGVYRVEDMVNKTLSFFLSEGLELVIYDGNPSSSKNIIYGKPTLNDAILFEEMTIDVGNRIWHFDWRAGENYLKGPEVLKAYLSLFSLLLFSFFIAIILNLMSNRQNMISELVKLRTTELEVANKELEQQKIVSIESAKLAAIGEMASSVAHEINNPLTIIMFQLQKLKKHAFRTGNIDEVIESGIERLEDTSMRIAKIVKGLSHISGDGGKEEFKLNSVNQIIDTSVGLCNERFRSLGAELKIIRNEEDVFINCKSIQIGQVLLNLLNNAFDAISQLDEKWVLLNCYEQDGYLIFSVKDSGYGVQKEITKKIFSPFYSTKPLGKGTGLGLSISKQIIAEHNGTLQINDESTNTEFQFKLPI